MSLWVQFILLSCVIFFAARGLVRASGTIAAKRGWADLWAGFLLLSFATTLPEIFTSVSAAAVFDAPDLSIGNLLGSVVFNLFIIAVLDIFQGPGPIMREADARLVLLGGCGLGLAAVAAIGILSGFFPSLRVSPFSALLLLGYLFGSRLVYSAGGSGVPRTGESASGGERACWIKYIICALTVLTAGLLLVRAVDGIAHAHGLGRTFAGTLLLAAATSLPEASVTVSAVRRGSYDMALGNILGANMLNFSVIFIADVFYPKGGILGAVSANHAITALLGILMTGALIIGIIYRSRKSFALLGWDSIVIAAAYFAGSYMLYVLR